MLKTDHCMRSEVCGFATADSVALRCCETWYDGLTICGMGLHAAGLILEQLGLAGFQPAGKTDEAALQAALKDHCEGANRLVRRLGRDKIVLRQAAIQSPLLATRMLTSLTPSHCGTLTASVQV